MVAHSGEAHRQLRHVFAVELGGVVRTQGEDLSAVGCHVRRDAGGSGLHDVCRFRVADGARDVVVVAIHQLPPLGEQVVRGGGIDQRALCPTKRHGVIAVADGGVAIATEGLRIVVVSRADRQFSGYEEAVTDGSSGGIVLIAGDTSAAGVGLARHRAIEDAVGDSESSAFRGCHDTCQGSIASKVGGERHTAATVGDGGRAITDAHDACQQFAVAIAGAVDGASNVQVLDGGIFDTLEQRAEPALATQVDFHRVAVAVEDAAERFVAFGRLDVRARRICHADVIGQLHQFAAVVFFVGVPDEDVPLAFAADDVGIVLRASAEEVVVAGNNLLAGHVVDGGHGLRSVKEELFVVGKVDAVQGASTVGREAVDQHKVIQVGPADRQRATVVVVVFHYFSRADARRILSACGRHLAAVDGYCATNAVVASLAIPATADAGRVHAARRIDRAAVDGDASSHGVVAVAAECSSKCTALDVDGAAVDDKFTSGNSTDARLGLIAIIDGQRARTLDGQSVVLAQLEALRCIEGGVLFDVQHDVAADGDASVDGPVFIDLIFARRQRGHRALDGSIVSHEEVIDHRAAVVARTADGHCVVAVVLCGAGLGGDDVVRVGRELLSALGGDGRYHIVAALIRLLFDAADGAELIEVGCHAANGHLSVYLAVVGRSIDLRSTVEVVWAIR